MLIIRLFLVAIQYEKISQGQGFIDGNKAGYTAQNAPSTRLKITGDGRTDRRTDGPTDRRTDGHTLL